MAYSELIKNFNKIREYMRDFYVYGFRTRSDFDQKSARSYDNERRRIESWLGDYMSFRQDRAGRHVFLSVDSRSVPFNPLYQAFKSKTFTANDITLHFLILDVLADGSSLTTTQILDQMSLRLSRMSETEFFPDESTLRKKLKEYSALGLLTRSRQGKEVRYCKSETRIDLTSWTDALCFASETDPVGVIGSFLLDQAGSGHSSRKYTSILRFKHHYLLNAFDQEILYQLMEARSQKRTVEITLAPSRKKKSTEDAPSKADARSGQSTFGNTHHVCPLRFCCSTQNGRRYLLAYEYGSKIIAMFRLDRIRRVRLLEEETCPAPLEAMASEKIRHLWGISTGSESAQELQHVEMQIHIEDHEAFVKDRLLREKRCGTVRQLDEHTLLFTADVCDALEMLPWIRTFTGRILSFTCSAPEVTERFWADLNALEEMYHALS